MLKFLYLVHHNKKDLSVFFNKRNINNTNTIFFCFKYNTYYFPAFYVSFSVIYIYLSKQQIDEIYGKDDEHFVTPYWHSDKH